MKVVFVISNIHLEQHRRGKRRLRWESTYREGVACIAGLLVSHDIEVNLLKVEVGLSDEAFTDLFARHFAAFDVAGFTMNSVDFPEAERLATLAKRANPQVTTVCGGVHCMLSPEESLDTPAFDMACVGEGERAMLELCEQLAAGRKPSDIAGLWIKQAGGIPRNEVRPLDTELGEVPPLRDIPTVTSYDPDTITDCTFFMATRGCPYRCSYCCNDALRALYPNRKAYHRYKPVESIIQELTEHLSRPSKEHFISFYDDVMMMDKGWFEEFSHRYAEQINRPTFLTGRWELLTEHSIPLIKKLVCVFLLVGVEVGDEKLRRGLLKRNQSSQMMLERAALLRRHGIRYGLFTMVGLPTETMEGALETVKLAARLRANPLPGHHSIFMPYVGTPLYEQCEQEGLIRTREVGSYFEDTRLTLPSFSRQAILAAHRRFPWFRIAYWLTWKLPAFIARRLEAWLDRRWFR